MSFIQLKGKIHLLSDVVRLANKQTGIYVCSMYLRCPDLTMY